MKRFIKAFSMTIVVMTFYMLSTSDLMAISRDPYQHNPDYIQYSGRTGTPTAGDGYQDGMSLYHFAKSNPQKYLDPSGMKAEAEITCDGKGGFEITYYDSYKEAPKCIQEIIEAHEKIHIQDFKKWQRHACKKNGQPNGAPLPKGSSIKWYTEIDPATNRAEGPKFWKKHFETRAYKDSYERAQKIWKKDCVDEKGKPKKFSYTWCEEDDYGEEIWRTSTITLDDGGGGKKDADKEKEECCKALKKRMKGYKNGAKTGDPSKSR